MTDQVPENDRRAAYTATDGQTVFDIDFPLDNVEFIEVFQNGDELVYPDDFSVNLADLEIVLEEGAEVDDSIVLEGRREIKRTTGYPLRGGLSSQLLNGDINAIIQTLQEMRRDIDRCMQKNKAESGDTSTFLPLKDTGHLIMWGAGGLENGPSTTDVSIVAGSIAAVDLLSEKIATLELLEDHIDAIDDVADDIEDVHAVGQEIARVVNVANSLTPITAVADDLVKIDGVYAKLTEISGVYLVLNKVTGVYDELTAVGIVADNIADVSDAADNMAAIIAAPAAAAAAQAYANAAASSAAEGLYNHVINKTYSDSPIAPSLSQEGYLFKVNTSGGNVVINLSALSTYGEDMTFAFVKITGDANTVTINRGGSDTINGATSKVLSIQFETHVMVGDYANGAWLDTVQAAGLADGSVTTSKIVDGAVTVAKMDTAANIRTYLDSARLTASQTFSGAQIGAVTALSTSSNHIAINMALNNNFSHTLSENTTLDNPTNATAGQGGQIAFTQDASTARTLAFGANWKEISGATPAAPTTLGAKFLLSYYVFNSTTIIYSLGKLGQS